MPGILPDLEEVIKIFVCVIWSSYYSKIPVRHCGYIKDVGHFFVCGGKWHGLCGCSGYVNQHALLGNAGSFVLWLECRMEDMENGGVTTLKWSWIHYNATAKWRYSLVSRTEYNTSNFLAAVQVSTFFPSSSPHRSQDDFFNTFPDLTSHLKVFL